MLFRSRLRTHTVIQKKEDYHKQAYHSYLAGLEVRVSKLGEPKFFKEMTASSREYLMTPRPPDPTPEFKDMATEEEDLDYQEQGPEKIGVQGKMTLIPVTIQLLDDERAAFRNVKLEFQLYLPESDPLVQGKILESEIRNPRIAEQMTDENGEATVHLLMDLNGKEVQVGREILQDNEKVLCRIFVETNKL